MGLFVFLTTAVANEVKDRRPGARHAMLVYVSADDFEAAQRKAAGAAIGSGWMLIRLEKGKPVDADRPHSDDAILSAAAQSATEEGAAIVVYGDELPPDA